MNRTDKKEAIASIVFDFDYDLEERPNEEECHAIAEKVLEALEGAKGCDACSGRGWLVGISSGSSRYVDGVPHVERCDACEHFESDEAALRSLEALELPDPRSEKMRKSFEYILDRAQWTLDWTEEQKENELNNIRDEARATLMLL